MSEFALFQSFMSEHEAAPVIEVLNKNGIEYELEKFKEPLDAVIAGEVARDQFYLKLKSEDFPKANEVLDHVILENISIVGKDYYLVSFSNDELLEIIKKPDEWSRQDFLIARKILTERGMDLSNEKINTIKHNRTRELSSPEKGSASWIILGYILAFLGGLMSLVIGLPYLVAKKTLPDGSRMYTYNLGTRNHGKAICIICVGMLVFRLIFNENGLKYAFIGFLSYVF